MIRGRLHVLMMMCRSRVSPVERTNVHPSQSSSPHHSAWVLVSSLGSVETTGCSCIAGLGRSCSHAASILWKVENAVSSGLTGIACTDEQRLWNVGTQRNLCPKRLTDITFSHHQATDILTSEVMPDIVPLPPTPSFCTQGELREGLKHLRLPVSSLLHKCVLLRHRSQKSLHPPYHMLTMMAPTSARGAWCFMTVSWPLISSSVQHWSV
ncbi:unnamed protein product [Leuciscus chuanchicus]